MAREMILYAFDMNCVGHQSQGLWRHPRDRSADFNKLSYWQDLAKTLERGLFDGIFLADVSGVYDVYGGSPDAALRAGTQIPANDPFTIIPVMAAATEHLSFGVTGSIPYEPPYSFARRISSLDHLTEGRVGWNIVTGYLDSAAKGAGRAKQIEHDTRYDIAAEYMEVVYQLWERSWEENAVVRDADSGVFVDPTRVHEIQHHGEYFDLEAIHLCEPSPQRTPVLFQAGTSPKGQAFASAHAECIFIGGTNPQAQAKTVRELRQSAAEQGRSPDDFKILSLVSVITADTDDGADAKLADYRQYASHQGALALVSGWTGIDFSRYGRDETVETTKSEAIQSILRAAGNVTVGTWAEKLAIGGGAAVLTGSPGTVADKLQSRMETSGVDGFNLSYTVMPECVEDFVDKVIPELQTRGLFKTDYKNGTLREKLFGRGPRLNAPHPAAQYRIP